MKKTFYITTPIYYVNGLPHIGHAYTSFAADVLARYHRLRGDDVFFLTGTDENAQKNVESAEQAGKPVASYVAEMSAKWQEKFDELSLTHDDFIRTTEERHINGVKKFIKAVWDKGDIYKGKYTGLYCIGCESFKTETDLVDGVCPDHRTRPKAVEEENYFFRLTKYRDALIDHLKKNPDFVHPEARRNEILRYISDAMTDISITRPRKEWGIPFPPDETQTIYVWFDALINYLTGVGYGTDEKKFKKWWPADVHLLGKDILKFHCALWPAMLMAAGLPLPRRVFAHGFFTIDDQKISKTIGNVVDAMTLASRYGLDAVRYFLFREIRLGSDGDFSETRLRERYNADLANGLGNLVSRVLTLAERHTGRSTPVELDEVTTCHSNYQSHLDALDLSGALEDIWHLIGQLDALIDREQPWKLAKTDPERLPDVLATLLESLRHVAVLLWPFLPESAEKILSELGVLELSRKTEYTKLTAWNSITIDNKIKKGSNLFPRL